ncbi:MAG: peptidylprolyl isomerase [candidate division Zixibacteria bacterium]|nr:peptidylprolyl isomerase [candidate division Zixibacteria bacterium]
MFDALRKAIVPIIVITLLFFVGLIVLEWGADFTGSRSGRNFNPNVAAVINGEEVPLTEYNRILNNFYQQEIDEYGGELPDDKSFELEDRAWKQLLYDHLIMQEVQKHNVIVTDEELYAYLRMSPPQYLQQIPQFQTEGRFDYQKYLNAMVDPQAAGFWASLEPMVKRDILKLKMQELIIQTAHVTEDEVKTTFLENEEKVKLGLINVGFSLYQNNIPEITDEEVELYYGENKDNYRVEERAVLEIAQIEKVPSSYDWEIAHTQIKQVYDSIMAGADFAEMAREYSQDNSAQSGGDLGWFPRGQMVSEFDSLSFSMNEGEISEPFRTQFGWHIIKHMGYKDEMEVPRGRTEKEKVRKAHVAHILFKVSTSQETQDNIYNQLQELLLLADRVGLDSAARELGVPLKKTMPFTRKSTIQYIGYDQQIEQFAFEEKVGSVSDIKENASSYYIVSVAEKIPSGVASLDEVRSRVRGDARNAALSKICKDTADAIYAVLQTGENWDKAARKYHCNYEETDLINRNNYLKGVGYDPKPMGVAFSLTRVNQMSEPVSYKTGCVIIKLIERYSPDLTVYHEKRDSLYSALKQQKQQELYGNWFNNLVEQAEIENYLVQANR